ncbi:MAG: phosphonate ABC transporter, permease protein PhnE [Acidobacteria bacterium]|nr:phosphonate ABC transporter, permease protein PhnE [Acidobacteriota bacterium]
MTAVPMTEAQLLAAVTPPFADRLRLRAAWTGLFALTAFCAWFVDLSPARLWEGFGKLGRLVWLMLPPDPAGFLGEFAAALAETLAMALAATLLAAALAFPLSLLGARNLAPHPGLRFGVRRLFDLLRGVEELIWAMIFVRVVGLGPMAGVIALTLSETGMLSKLFAETFEQAEQRMVDSLRAAGANKAEVVRFAVLPRALPVMASHVLYFLESNVRSSTILGIVGAGGVGFQLADRIRVNEWRQVGCLIVLILLAVATIDWISGRLRRRLIEGGKSAA